MENQYAHLKVKKSDSKPHKLPGLNTNNLRIEPSPYKKNSVNSHKLVSKRIANLKVKCATGGPLTTWEIAKYRQSKFEIILKEMLSKGYHRSFSILFNIDQERERKRLIEGPDSTRWKLTSLQFHPKLDQIRDYLCMIEDSQRNEDYTSLLTATGFLIRTFGQFDEDGWIVQQFVSIELESSKNVKYDSGYLKALANLTAGINAEKSYDYNLAAEHLARVFSMAYSQTWLDSEGQPMLRVCSEHLCQVYLHLACEIANTKPTQMLAYLKQAHEISKEAGLKTVEATCCLELGKVFEKLKNIDMAIAYYRGLFEVTHSINDQYRLGLANESLSRCYEKQHNKLEATRYMEKFVAIAEKSCDWHEYARSCRVMGELYNRYGEYHKAKEAFNNSFQVTYCLKTPCEFNQSKLLNGVAVGNMTNQNVGRHIVANTRDPITKFLNFRADPLNRKTEMLNDPVTDPNVITFKKQASRVSRSLDKA